MAASGVNGELWGVWRSKHCVRCETHHVHVRARLKWLAPAVWFKRMAVRRFGDEIDTRVYSRQRAPCVRACVDGHALMQDAQRLAGFDFLIYNFP